MKKRKSGVFSKVVIITIVLAVAAVGCIMGSRYMTEKKATRLEEMQAEVKAANQQAEQDYQADLAAFRAENPKGANKAWPSPKAEGWDIVDLTSYPLESPTKVTMARQDMLYNGLLVVNQWHLRPQDFDESLAVKIHTYSKNAIRVSKNAVSLLPAAADAWIALMNEATVQHGYKFFMVEDGFRSYDEQAKLVEQNKSKIPAGGSDFNAGLSVHPRLYESGNAELNAKDSNFFTSEEGMWLNDNAWRYGFVFRFPLADYPTKGTLDKSYITGINQRLRYYRYVGEASAAIMYHTGMCLEEYIDYLGAHNHVAVFEDGILRYEILREYVDGDDMVTVTQSSKPGVQAVHCLLDNMGYVVVILEY